MLNVMSYDSDEDSPPAQLKIRKLSARVEIKRLPRALPRKAPSKMSLMDYSAASISTQDSHSDSDNADEKQDPLANYNKRQQRRRIKNLALSDPGDMGRCGTWF